MAVWLMVVLLALILGLVGLTTEAWWLLAVGAVLLLVGAVLGARRRQE
ncbi:MAG TPA: LPXTG cell wall anchor domain-containing protein [Candidatus Nanopelagicales bacterium]|nr:LPXTG cell wall anchor domain-containing protein [Candidatus Nanopelagicales bacterium]